MTRLWGEMALSLSFPSRDLWTTTCVFAEPGVAFLCMNCWGCGWTEPLPDPGELRGAWISPVLTRYCRSENWSTVILYVQPSLNPISWLAVSVAKPLRVRASCLLPTSAPRISAVTGLRWMQTEVPHLGWLLLLPLGFRSYMGVSSSGGSCLTFVGCRDALMGGVCFTI